MVLSLMLSMLTKLSLIICILIPLFQLELQSSVQPYVKSEALTQPVTSCVRGC